MATSSRQSSLFGVNDWKTIYKTFSQADFKSYDYETLRKSFIDYLRLNYPETFNDYTESSEFIALLDVIAFMGQGLAFRNDLNTRENFIDTAERRDSVIKLANLINYSPKRNICASGYLKIVSIQTTENVTDVNGTNLGNATILWNDPANSNWLDQFNSILNAALINTQRIGRPGNSQIIMGVKTDEYSVSIPSTVLPIIPFSATVDGTSMDFEAVSASSVDSDDIYEVPPTNSGVLNMLYRNDKLGYGSPNTGFFFYFKQGTLAPFDFNVQQQVSNAVINIGAIEGINNSDTWLYQINSVTGAQTPWRQVASVYANAAQSADITSVRKIFSVVSRFNDQVSYSFGDGVFSEIPIGLFRAYVRSSNGLTYTIDPSEIQGTLLSFSYLSRTGRTETLTVAVELPTPVSNAQARESLASIKQRAPTQFYTQNRMVNGEDYSSFPYVTYGSIIKSKAINRTSIGVSRNLDLLDPTQKYSSTNCFGSDGALYQDTNDAVLNLTITNSNDIIAFLTGPLTEALNSAAAKQYYMLKFPRYTQSTLSSATIRWTTSTSSGNSVTGYFYTPSSINLPVPVGTFSSTNLKYATKGALVKFTAPIIAGIQYYFDSNNRLTTTQSATTRTTLWTTVLNVVGDGSNFGNGNFPNGSGPITLNGYVPPGVTFSQIIPVFGNIIPSTVLEQCVQKMEVGQNFTLIFNNALLISQVRWSIGSYTDPNYMIKFTSTGANTYTVSYRSVKYLYGSVSDTRFLFDEFKVVYDPKTGKTLQDFVKILGSNTSPAQTGSIGGDIQLSIVGQTVEPDGFVNNFYVEVASTDPTDTSITLDPDFFYTVTGYDYSITPTPTNTRYFVFLKLVQDSVDFNSYEIIPTADVVWNYATKADIELIKYDYPVGQLFYAYSTNLFYISVQDVTIQTPNFTLVTQTAGDYIARTGRQPLNYQYRHNSNNTTRIDPSTTNIIDLYIVTQSYYTNYVKWIQDTTNTVVQPDRPTINDMNTLYSSGVNQYKMISDAVVFNSVVFKPLFGSKAAPELQAKIKVIKASLVTVSDSEIRSAVLSAMNDYFSINNWDFGDTFYFSQLSAYLHSRIGEFISSVVLVPNNPNSPFGTLYEIKCAPYEIFVNGAVANDIVVISALTPAELQMNK